MDIQRVKKYSFWTLIAITLVLSILAKTSDFIVDHLYQGGIFQLIRVIYDYTLGWLPFPFIYLAVAVVVFFFCRILISRDGFFRKLVHIGQLLIVLICLFYLLWGLNYQSTSIEDKLNLEMKDPSIEQLKVLFEESTDLLNDLSINRDTNYSYDFQKLESDLRPLLESQLEDFGYPTNGRVRVRKIIPGALLLFRTSGIYIPHALEGHVDGGLYKIQWPFTLAHEMAHGYGITKESDCNFIAYLVCKASPNYNVKYSGELAYWRYLASQLLDADKEAYELIRSKLSPDVEKDLLSIREHIIAYPDLMPKYRNIIYDNYLKSHGVAAGIKSYDRMILLIEAWKLKNEKDGSR